MMGDLLQIFYYWLRNLCNLVGCDELRFNLI